MLQIYNSLTKKKEVFAPIVPGKVGIYVCGMTVYDYCHLGHARVLVSFDVVVRYLRSLGYAVTYVRNITDIDDKIIQRARENGEDVNALTERFIQAMQEDSAALSVVKPDIEPRATDSISDIVAMISVLIDKGYAYIAANKDIYYDVSCFHTYGCFSGSRPEELLIGARVDIDEAKADPLDFVLWKTAKPGEPSWDSPWGAGRPGWHIECSAMATRCLGEHFDIHGGGMDLKFPHHENEIAQSEAATGRKFVNIWMHNGFVRVNEEKMSKSLGNFFSLREILSRYRPEEVRYFILASHYRSPLNYSEENLQLARSSLQRLYTSLRGHDMVSQGIEVIYQERFITAMDDDFSTTEALSVLFGLANDCNRIRTLDAAHACRLAATLRHLGGFLGILQEDPNQYLQGFYLASANDTRPDESIINDLIEQRYEARQARRWSESDRIRDVLKEQGVLLEDGPEGTTWRRQEP